MINFNNKKTKRWFTGILMILIVAMVVPMVVYLIP